MRLFFGGSSAERISYTNHWRILTWSAGTTFVSDARPWNNGRCTYKSNRPVERQRRWSMTWPVAAVAALGLALALPLAAQAKTFRCNAGDVACLIAAINAANANSGNTIRLAAGTYTLTAVDNSSRRQTAPVITSPLTITGRGRAPALNGTPAPKVSASWKSPRPARSRSRG